MKPLLYSEREATVGRLGWKRIGFNISYYKNPLLQREFVYYTLSFYMVYILLITVVAVNSLRKRKYLIATDTLKVVLLP